MELTSCQQVHREQKASHSKNSVAAQNAPDVEKLLSFSVLDVHGLQRSHVLLPLKKLLKIVIAIQIKSLIYKLRYTIGMRTQDIFNEWADLYMLPKE